MKRRSLLFVSTRFVFPANEGGKIRTSEVLRNLKGGAFDVTFLSPSSAQEREQHAKSLSEICDRHVHWDPDGSRRLRLAKRALGLISPLPLSIVSDYSLSARRAIAAELRKEYAVTVFDFVHSTILAPRSFASPSVVFTHNREAEIFLRHAGVATNPLMRAIWRREHQKMSAYEKRSLRRFDAVIAVSERDKTAFEEHYGLTNVRVIPTGVNLDYFDYLGPEPSGRVVFTGALDWPANIDGLGFLMTEVWPKVLARVPHATMRLIGRDPSRTLVRRAEALGLNWEFLGRVPDIRPHVKGAAAFVIPLRVGGGTRIKVYEAMAMGIPVVSTAIGVEGLPIRHGEHYLEGNDASALANQLCEALTNQQRANELAGRARDYVETNFSNRVVGRRFEEICLSACR